MTTVDSLGSNKKKSARLIKCAEQDENEDMMTHWYQCTMASPPPSSTLSRPLRYIWTEVAFYPHGAQPARSEHLPFYAQCVHAHHTAFRKYLDLRKYIRDDVMALAFARPSVRRAIPVTCKCA